MKRAQKGFTLLELMLVVTIAGILLGIGIPAMGNLIRSARITGAANDVMAGLQFARSEAIKRRVPVTLCTSANPLAANPVCTASALLTGWIAFVDDNGDNIADASDGNGVRDVGELLLLQREPLPNTITGRSTANPFRATYLNTGFALNVNQTQLVLCDERGNVRSGGELSAARGITISVTGRAGVTRDLGEIQTLINAIGVPIAGCS
jgi:type IV fimbrial biogenesis protein FimT